MIVFCMRHERQTKFLGKRSERERGVSYFTHSRGDQDGCSSSSEAVQSSLAITLGTVAMDTCTEVPLGVEEVVESITSLLGLDKDE